MENVLVGNISIFNKIKELHNEESFIMMNAATDISITDISGKILFVNDNFLKATGFSKEELLGNRHRVINSSYHSDHYWSTMWTTIKSGKQWSGIIRNQKKNGEHYWVNTRIFPLKDSKQDLIGFMSFRSDITESKVYQSLLRESESKLKALYDSNPDAYILISLDKKPIYYNKSAKKLIHKLTGKKLNPEINIADTLKSYKYIDWNNLNKPLPDEDIRIENKLIFKDGTKVWYTVIHRAVFNHDKEHIGTSITLRNIHKEKIADEAIKQSQKKYENLYNNTPSIYFTLDSGGVIKSVNDFGAKSLGYKVNELLEQPIKKLISHNYINEANNQIEKCIHSPGKFFSWELEKISKQGKAIIVNESAWASKDETGKIQVNIVCEDITQKKASEANIKIANERLTALIESIPDAIFFKDGESRWLITNQTAKDLFQLDGVNWQGKSEQELADMRPAFREAHEACIVGDELAWQAKKLIKVKETVINKAGEVREFEVRKMPVFNEDGTRKALVIIGTDVTERNRIEAELVDEQNLFMGGPTLIFRWRAEPGWPIDYVSSNVLERLGYTPDELLNVHYSELIHAQDLKRVENEVESLHASSKSSYGLTYRIKWKNGKYRWIYDYSFIKRDENNNVLMSLGYLNDITEKLESEKKIILQNEKLLEIAWIFSHEVRAPVASLKGLSNIFNYEDINAPINKEVLLRIQQPIDNLNKIISSIVDKTYEVKMEDELFEHNIAHQGKITDS